MKRVLSAMLCLVTLMSFVNINTLASENKPVQTANQIGELDGVWEGSLPVFLSNGTYFNDVVTININESAAYPVHLKITSLDAQGVYVAPKAYQMYKNVLNFELYDDSWYSVAELKLTGPDLMEGTYSQKKHKMPIEFKRISRTPVDEKNMKTQFLFDGETQSHWLEELKKYPKYEKKGKVIPYSYALNQWDKTLPMINLYGLDKMAEGKTDIEIMQAVMKIVNDNFDHNGDVAITDKTDPLTIIALHNEKGGVECRGLAVILSEMLRTCGIEAKPIMCISSKEPAECHEVVHAYSPSLNQWIMIDPTYNLMLKDKDGNYVDLPRLRQALINGEPLHANDEANYNGAPFYMPRYREYMTKNTFRFASAQDFYFGSKIFPDTDVKGESNVEASDIFGNEFGDAANDLPDAKNPIYMLVPCDYKVPFAYSRKEIITTDAEAFWALPERSKEIAAQKELEAKKKAEEEAAKAKAAAASSKPSDSGESTHSSEPASQY